MVLWKFEILQRMYRNIIAFATQEFIGKISLASPVVIIMCQPEPHDFHCEAWRGKTKFFLSPGTIWAPCDKGELAVEKKGLLFLWLANLNNKSSKQISSLLVFDG